MNNNTNHVINNFKAHFTTYFSISLVLLLFILFFQPFSPGGIMFENFEDKVLFMSGFGLIVFILLYGRELIPANIYTQDYEEKNDNTLTAYLADFILAAAITVSFAFYLRYVGNVEISFFLAIKMAIMAISVPVARNIRHKIVLAQLHNSQLKNQINALEKKLSQYAETYADAPLELHSEYSADVFRVQANQIIYVSSADNYVEVGYLQDNQFKKHLIRNTLKNIEQQLISFPGFIRTHRTSIVNMQFVEDLNKKNNKYWLTLNVSAQTIPVARQYLMVVKELL